VAKVERLGVVSGKSATEVYEGAVQTFEESGFDVWKKRPIAWLVMVKMMVKGCGVEGNLAARPTVPPSYTLTLSSEKLTEEALGEIADSVVESLHHLLSD
jgi:hypothetical protein